MNKKIVVISTSIRANSNFFCGGVSMGGEISENAKLKEAYDLGAGV